MYLSTDRYIHPDYGIATRNEEGWASHSGQFFYLDFLNLYNL